MLFSGSRRAPPCRHMARCLALTALLSGTSAWAQSTPQGAPPADAAGGPLGSATPPGERPPQSQPLAAEAIPGGRTGPPGLPQAIRWTENWSKPPAADAPILDKIRHIPLGRDDIYLSLGGEMRLYYTDWNHAALGRTSGDSNSALQSRARLIADLHVGPYVRGYVELGDNREYGEEFATGPNRDKVDIYQAFVDVTVPLGNAGKITVRPGRFEMPLGNGKLVGVREGLNMRFTYQGVRATYILPGKISVDAFAVRPVSIKPETFDDGPNHAASFKGVYVSAPRGLLGLGTDVYWYAVDRDRGIVREATGEDRRDNWGARLWTRNARWDFDLEADRQTGRIDTQEIQAWAVLFEGGYTFADTPWKPRLGLRANAFSGDGKLSDGKASTFVPAAPRLPLISEAAFFNLSNLVDAYPSVTVKPRKDITIMAGPDFLWRQRKADGVYIGPTGASFAPYGTTNYIGTDLNLEASWQATKQLQFRLFETYFSAGDAFGVAGGRNGNYFGVLSDLRF